MAWQSKDDMLIHQAKMVLDFNWMGEYTMPGPRLYPHQWSWDSALISIGYSHYDQHRATSGLTHLFEAQWKNGLLPQIVFNPTFNNYFPGPNGFGDAEVWAAMTDRTHGISEKFHGKGRGGERYLSLTIGKAAAKARVSGAPLGRSEARRVRRRVA
jgi:hypothetical protein